MRQAGSRAPGRRRGGGRAFEVRLKQLVAVASSVSAAQTPAWSLLSLHADELKERVG